MFTIVTLIDYLTVTIYMITNYTATYRASSLPREAKTPGTKDFRKSFVFQFNMTTATLTKDKYTQLFFKLSAILSAALIPSTAEETIPPA